MSVYSPDVKSRPVAPPLMSPMSTTIPSPRRRYPLAGSYVVLSIDPKESLKNCPSSCWEADEDLRKKVEGMTFRQYVVLLEEAPTISTHAPLFPYDIRFVMQGKPFGSPAELIQKDWVVGIDCASITFAPSESEAQDDDEDDIRTSFSHSSKRQSIVTKCITGSTRLLTPSAPLPWSECYHSSFVDARVLCVPCVVDQAPGEISRLNAQNMMRLEDWKSDDYDSWEKVKRKKARESTDSLYKELPVYPSQTSVFSACEALHTSKFFPVVNVSYDLSNIGGREGILADPRKFFQEALSLSRLEQEYITRKALEKTQADFGPPIAFNLQVAIQTPPVVHLDRRNKLRKTSRQSFTFDDTRSRRSSVSKNFRFSMNLRSEESEPSSPSDLTSVRTKSPLSELPSMTLDPVRFSTPALAPVAENKVKWWKKFLCMSPEADEEPKNL